MTDPNAAWPKFVALLRKTAEERGTLSPEQLHLAATSIEALATEIDRRNERPAAINVVIDDTEPNEPRFVEVEDDQQRSIRVGEHTRRDDGLWSIRITAADLAPTHPPTREQIADVVLANFHAPDRAHGSWWITPEATADAVLALIQNGANRG